MGRILGLVGRGLAVVGLCGIVSGCAEDLKNFQCQRADFDKLESRMASVTRTSETSRSSDRYDSVKAWNEKLAQVCPIEVLQKCAAGHTRATVVGQSSKVSGPINTFGIDAYTDFQNGRGSDGLGSIWEPQLVYVVEVNRQQFSDALKCFRDSVN